ncbi:MAG TPA: septum formation family protein [Acidimicrobiales bacterium]|jgi:hypothetical protein|nr:septum formation family protein [Acidimicrobiales bacterium]|tara:strand:- start:643 stop:1059 length:417 start_codon:yes stop_codon:yes gene_type:complete
MKKIYGFLVVLLFAFGCSQNNVFSLKVGQCFADSVFGEEVTNVDIVDCDEPHLNEIYAVTELPDGDFPLVFIQEDSVELCYQAFEPFVGQAYEYSIYEIGFLHPTKETWDELDDREVVCYLFDINEKMKTGTAANSGR